MASQLMRRVSRENCLAEIFGLPMTDEAHIVATPPVAAPPARDLGSPSATPPPAAAAKPAVAPVPAASAQPAPPAAFPVTLQFDQDTHRLFIEARDSSGLVVVQIPFKPAVSTSGGSTSTTTRGQRVNSEA